MKVKYFLRGLGMGIIFTTLLMMTVVGTKKEALADEEIMTRASLLGMVRADEGLEPKETPAVTETPVATETPNVTKTPVATEKPVETRPPEETKEPEKPKEPEYVTVTIKGGMWSKDVAKAMEAAGLVSSAEKFDEYLCDNGYASFISVGTFKIKVGADFREIAEKITK
ncbi:hypothetical protein [Acetivibrio ethanolgignens]|uniref:Aminodeoxychorismate lyase n=1 Tax=Acetivibrio ethanolgignens TaxID=290052 RepID=A0A0V8QJH2_9FIRM|nr:hypothetical protein [Acetivibrio ethanolgignens]KSV60709.1 hypothetical protein ASU35_00630 [Acetivibrio ethanolgignens]